MRQERINQKLTPRQIEVLNLLAGGTIKEVALILGISLKTVQNILEGHDNPHGRRYKGAYERLGVHTKVQAVMEAIRRGYINPKEVEMQLRHEEEAIT